MKNTNEDPIKNTPSPAQRVVIDRVQNGWRVGAQTSISDFTTGVAGADYVFNDPDELARNVRQLIAPGPDTALTNGPCQRLFGVQFPLSESGGAQAREVAALRLRLFRVEADAEQCHARNDELLRERDQILNSNRKLLAEIQALKFPPAPVPVSLFGPDGNPVDGFRPGDLWTSVGGVTRCIISASSNHITYWLCISEHIYGSSYTLEFDMDPWGGYVGSGATRTRADFQPASHPGEPPQGFRVGDMWESKDGTTRRIFEVSPEAIFYKNSRPNGTEMDDRLRRPRASAEWPLRVGPGAKLIRK